MSLQEKHGGLLSKPKKAEKLYRKVDMDGMEPWLDPVAREMESEESNEPLKDSVTSSITNTGAEAGSEVGCTTDKALCSLLRK